MVMWLLQIPHPTPVTAAKDSGGNMNQLVLLVIKTKSAKEKNTGKTQFSQLVQGLYVRGDAYLGMIIQIANALYTMNCVSEAAQT